MNIYLSGGRVVERRLNAEDVIGDNGGFPMVVDQIYWGHTDTMFVQDGSPVAQTVHGRVPASWDFKERLKLPDIDWESIRQEIGHEGPNGENRDDVRQAEGAG